MPADDDRWMRLLGGFGKGPNRWKTKIAAVILRLIMCPERLHHLDSFPRLRPAVLEVATHELGFFPQPARPNPEQAAPAAKAIEAGDLLGQEEWVALGYQGDACAELQGASD